MRPEDVELPPKLKHHADAEWAGLASAVRKMSYSLGGGGLAVVGWILFSTWRDGRLAAPRAEEVWPMVGGLVIGAFCVLAVRWSRGTSPLRHELSLPGAKITWVGLAIGRGPRSDTLVSLRFGFANGVQVSVLVDPPRLTAPQRLELAKALEQEAVAFFRPAYSGPGSDQKYQLRPGG